jgi:alcohol dehydrogenase class IV
VSAGFTWRDGERLIRFGPGAAEDAARLVAEAGFAGYALLSTERALMDPPPGLREEADAVLEVPAGRVDELSAELLGAAGRRPLVALGGGRVIDVAKAIAGAPPQGSRGAEGRPTGEGAGRCAAVPTTLSGAPMTPFHRTPAGVEGARRVRPALVIADPERMVSQPATMLAASAMNALAHAMESLYTPLANPVSELAALRAASLIAVGVPQAEPQREELGLASILAGYAVGATGLAMHHALCQTIVRIARSPHAETNAVVLPHSARLMARRAPAPLAALAEALGDPAGDPAAAAGLISKLAARSGHTRLSALGVTEDHLPQIVETAQGHRGIEATPGPPGRDELLELLRAAL